MAFAVARSGDQKWFEALQAERANTARRDAEIHQRDIGLSALAC